MQTILEKKCLVCKNKFYKPVWISLKNWNISRKYCSRLCLDRSKLGNTYRRGKKHPNIWNKGISSPKGELNQSWKGNKAGYSAKHKWVKSQLGSSDTCDHCGQKGFKPRQIHWSNKDHKYNRILSDWQRLCAQCHITYDKENGLI